MATANYFTTFRAERTTTRSEELLQLDAVIANYEEGSEKHEEVVYHNVRCTYAVNRT